MTGARRAVLGGVIGVLAIGACSGSSSEAEPSDEGGAGSGGAAVLGGRSATATGGARASGGSGGTVARGGSGEAETGGRDGGRAGGGSDGAGNDSGGGDVGAPAVGGAAHGGAPAAGAGNTGASLTERHPDEASLLADPAVLFHDDFEDGWGKWDRPSRDTAHLFVEDDARAAHGGSRYLRSTVTEAQLADDEYISSSTEVTFPQRAEQLYIRFYARFEGISPPPHHWVRVAAGTESFQSSGLANTVPAGDEGFWFDFDANVDDRFNFYVYWYEMRSGRCNDGSTTPGCAGDQGTTYHYGNTFAPAEQPAFPRDAWLCIELMAKANQVGSSDGELAFWVNDEQRAVFRPGEPEGTWLRDRFHPGGCDFSACEAPMPFEGFDFRSSDDVLFKSFFLDAYYERETTGERRAELESRGLSVSPEQTILYDDVVVATSRIGCGRFP